MDIKKFLNSQINDLKNIINNLDFEFTSHDFLKKFAKNFERDYILFLDYYKDRDAFQIVHSQIGRFLSENAGDLNIKKTKKVPSENIFGEIDDIQEWSKR